MSGSFEASYDEQPNTSYNRERRGRSNNYNLRNDNEARDNDRSNTPISSNGAYSDDKEDRS